MVMAAEGWPFLGDYRKSNLPPWRQLTILYCYHFQVATLRLERVIEKLGGGQLFTRLCYDR
jgi:hypothetical protein